MFSDKQFVYNTLRKEIIKDLTKWRDILSWWLNTINMTIISKLIYWFNVLLSKILAGYFLTISKLILKWIWKRKRSGTVKTMYSHTEVFTWMFIAILFIIIQIENNPLTVAWRNKVWYICSMKYHSVIRRNELLLHTTTWMNIKIIIPEVRQKKNKYFLILFIKTLENEN